MMWSFTSDCKTATGAVLHRTSGCRRRSIMPRPGRNTYSDQKPPYSYIALTAMAIQSSPDKVSIIYMKLFKTNAILIGLLLKFAKSTLILSWCLVLWSKNQKWLFCHVSIGLLSFSLVKIIFVIVTF